MYASGEVQVHLEQRLFKLSLLPGTVTTEGRLNLDSGSVAATVLLLCA